MIVTILGTAVEAEIAQSVSSSSVFTTAEFVNGRRVDVIDGWT